MHRVDMAESLKSSRSRGEHTRKLANLIVRRLSGRDDLKGCEYELIFEGNKVLFKPDVNVYLDRHRRKPTDSRKALELIMTQYFPFAVDKIDNHEVYVKDDVFVSSGHYIYSLSADRRRRKWVAIR